jgi:hypothetical protein
VLPIPGVNLGTVGETVFELPLDEIEDERLVDGTVGDIVGLNPPNEEEGEVEDEVDEGMLGVLKEPEFAGIDGRDGVDGIDGIDGIDRIDGVDGIDRIDGVDGIDGIEGMLLTGLLLLAGMLTLLLI